MQTISLADRLHFLPAEELLLRCRGMSAGPDNLILRAARLLRERVGGGHGAKILCEKRIPVGSGLGGGSSDAAATLIALNQLWNAELDIDALTELAPQLGSDVPFFLHGGTAVATGTGTNVECLEDAPAHWVVLALAAGETPDKTASMYAALDESDLVDGSRCRAQVAALRQGCLAPLTVSSSFWGPATRRWRHLSYLQGRLMAAGAIAATVAGSGPSSFGLFPTRSAAIHGLRAAREVLATARMYRFVGRMATGSNKPDGMTR
jgi:4-diphosphocytidyl-2-C-methyl-D-erythritol kinase